MAPDGVPGLLAGSELNFIRVGEHPMAIGGADAHAVQTAAVPQMARPVTVGWFVKRSLVGIAILLVAMGGLAWLTYASIDQSLEGATAASPTTASPETGDHSTPARLMPVEL